jgi:REP element-mobilizing transposase RayT
VQKRLSIDLHEYVIMPNHVHLLLGVNVWKWNINNMGNTYLDNMAWKSDNMAWNLDNMAWNSDNMAWKSGDMAWKSDNVNWKSDNINVVPTLYDTIQTPHHTVGTGFLSEYHNITHQSLGSIIGTRKAGVSRTCHEKWYPFARQSRYHDHIVRNEKEYNAIKHYIRSNPERWKQDTFWRTI